MQQSFLLPLFWSDGFMQDWSRHSIFSQSQVPLYQKYIITVIYTLSPAHKENAVWISRHSSKGCIVQQTLPN